MEFPKYMQQGSRGPLVTLLQVFLCGVRGSLDVEIKDLIFDGEYGDVTANLVNAFQVEHGLEADGHFGPATRAVVKEEYGFDFEAAAKTIPGMTSFHQPGGSKIARRFD